ncbi:hypothetical protein [Shinella sp. M27]|uniref:hypothetical protein n=1 Tax=Shinella sp. M27 TaxID=3368614 RepID=UPI003B9EE17F
MAISAASASERAIAMTGTTYAKRPSSMAMPSVDILDRAIARVSAMASAMPVAADRKFCTVRPAIWLEWLSLVSPS